MSNSFAKQAQAIVADADSQASYLNDDGVLFMAIYSPSPDVTTYRTRTTLSSAFVRVASLPDPSLRITP